MAHLVADLVTDAGEFAALAPDWTCLWRHCPQATPFQSPAWLQSWWHCFAPGRLLTVAVRRGGDLVGLAPLYVEDGAGRLLAIGVSLSDYLDVLALPEEAESVTDAIADRLGCGEWRECSLDELGPDALAWRLPCPRGCEAATSDGTVTPVAALPETIDALWAGWSGHKRRHVTNSRNRAARAGTVTIASADETTVAESLALLFRLHERCWQTRGEAGVLGNRAVRALHEAAAPAFWRAGVLRLYTLSISGVPAAVYYGFVHRGRAYGYQAGWNPDFAYQSPGTVVIAHAIEEAVREGAGEFDFLRGGEAYKYAWGAKDRRNRHRRFRRFCHA